MNRKMEFEDEEGNNNKLKAMITLRRESTQRGKMTKRNIWKRIGNEEMIRFVGRGRGGAEGLS